MKHTRNIFIIVSIVFILLITACDPSPYYPQGSVTIENRKESADATNKTLVVTVAICNTGLSKINRTTFTLKLSTDIGSYYKTLVSETVILPSAAIYENTSVIYPIGEVYNTAEILDAFFE